MRECRNCRAAIWERICPQCGHDHAQPSPPPRSENEASKHPVWIRPGVLVIVLTAIAAGILSLSFVSAQRLYQAERQRLSQESLEAIQEHENEVAYERRQRQDSIRAAEAAHRTRLSHQRLISGELARANHYREWERRLNRDPIFATSASETNLLRMRAIGADTAIGAQEALRQVALMASPPGSRVEISPAGSQFNVRVAFKLSEMTRDERGGSTKHRSIATLRREVELLSARLIKDLFDYCGSRGIERLSVSCNRAVYESPVPEGATPEERKALVKTGELIMRSLYRVAVDGSAVPVGKQWRSMSEPAVLRLAVVEKDKFSDMTISQENRRDTRDPDMPLEF